jgi:hypothetical protein
MMRQPPHPPLRSSLSLKGEGLSRMPSPFREKVAEGRMRVSLFVPFLVLLLVGCNKPPFERTKDPSTVSSGVISGTHNFVVFNNELTTGGGAFEYPGSEGQNLSFSDTSNPISHRSIRYSWNGEPVSNLGCPAQNPTSAFAGFDLMHTISRNDYAAQGRDLSGAGYTKVTFYARGTLSTNTYLKVEVASPGNPNNACVPAPSSCLKLINSIDPAPGSEPTCGSGTLTSGWSSFSVIIPSPATDLANIRDFFKATFVYLPTIGAPSGQGGTVYFDVIQYQP